jgi:cell fate regulator YaaT (PSP1 superfamily)
MDICHQEVKKADLPMKIVGADYSFDGGSITFAFIADSRIDFRELVKTLSKTFQRSIRLYQIGARDESRQTGGYGICGRQLCCVRFKRNLPSISSEMAKIQQISHRGSDRISGLCSRLMCCLAYEASQYREMLEKYPRIGDTVRHNGSDVVVKDINILSGKIRVELSDKSLVSIKLSDIQ